MLLDFYEWALEIRAGYRRPESGNKALHAFTRSVFAQLVLSPLVFLVWRQRRSGGATPSAWDALFDKKELRGFVRAKLRSGPWVGGVYVRIRGEDRAEHGFAAGYPDPQSLYLPIQLVLDPETGEVTLGENGPLTRDWGLLLHGQDVEILEFQRFEIDGKAP